MNCLLYAILVVVTLTLSLFTRREATVEGSDFYASRPLITVCLYYQSRELQYDSTVRNFVNSWNSNVSNVVTIEEHSSYDIESKPYNA